MLILKKKHVSPGLDSALVGWFSMVITSCRNLKTSLPRGLFLNLLSCFQQSFLDVQCVNFVGWVHGGSSKYSSDSSCYPPFTSHSGSLEGVPQPHGDENDHHGYWPLNRVLGSPSSKYTILPLKSMVVSGSPKRW